MRLVFISLIVANLSIAVWGAFFRSAPEESQSASVVSTATFKAGASSQVVSSQDGDESAKDEESVSEGLCQLVGAFEGADAAQSFVQRLASIDIKAQIKNVELPAGVSYWVHLEPEETREAAFRKLAELQSQNIESYVIGKGVLANAVSLGVFTVESIADAHFAELTKMGLEPIKTEFERKDLEVWVEISSSEARKMSELTWARMLDGLPKQERRQNFCLPVAS